MRFNPFSRHVTWRSRALDLGLGALAVLGFAPFGVWPLTVLAFAALYVRLAGHTMPKQGWSSGFWFGVGYFAFGLFWITSAFVERGPEYIPFVPPLVGGLVVLLSLFWAWAGRQVVATGVGGLWRVALFGSLLFLAEWLRGHLFGGFPWNLPAHALSSTPLMMQGASVVGAYGLSYLLLLAAGGLGEAWAARRARWWPGAAVGLGTLLGMALFGTVRLSGAPDIPERLPDVRLRLVHVPFRQSEMMDPAGAVQLTNRYFETTLSEPLDGVTHIVWPEGAVRGVSMDDLDFLLVWPSVLEDPPHFLFSSIRVEEVPREGERFYNSAVAASYPDRYPQIAAWSDKRRLVPMGEVVPFSETLSRFGFEAIAASFTPAPDKRNVSYPGLPAASVQICYEIIFGGLTEGSPAFILNQSNDAWFGRTTGPAQHAAIARFRAVEEGVPLVRAAANGDSGVVDAYGRWVTHMGADTQGVLDVGVPEHTVSTPFRRETHGILLLLSLVGWLCVALAGRTDARGARMPEGGTAPGEADR